ADRRELATVRDNFRIPRSSAPHFGGVTRSRLVGRSPSYDISDTTSPPAHRDRRASTRRGHVPKPASVACLDGGTGGKIEFPRSENRQVDLPRVPAPSRIVRPSRPAPLSRAETAPGARLARIRRQTSPSFPPRPPSSATQPPRR